MRPSEELLVMRARRYEVLQAIFDDEPTGPLLLALARPEVREVLTGECGLAPDAPLVAVLIRLGREFGLGGEDSHALAVDAAERLRGEYGRLIVGPACLPAPPWGSCYLTRDGALFGPETLAVRRWYARHGFLVRGYPHEADDHLAFELDFMAYLAGESVERLHAGDASALALLLDEQRIFLERHLCSWLPQFARAMACADGCIYPQAAAAIDVLTACDLALLGTLEPLAGKGLA